MSRAVLSTWLPDRAPERRDVVLVGTALWFAGLFLTRPDGVAWLWVVVGFVVNAVVFGPLATSAAGQRIDTRLQGFNSIGQKGVIALAILLTVAVIVVTLPGAIGRGFVTGAFLFIALSLTANFLSTIQPQGRQASN